VGGCTNRLVIADGARGQPLAARSVAHTPGLGLGEVQSAVAESGRAAVVWSEGDNEGYGTCFGKLIRARFHDGETWSTPVTLAKPDGLSTEWTMLVMDMRITDSGRVLLSRRQFSESGVETLVHWVDPPPVP